jgi:hypothetical protein
MSSLKNSEGCWKEKRVVDVDEPNRELVRKVIESKVGSAGNRV